VLFVSFRVWKGSAFGGTKGRSQLPGIVDKYLEGKLKVDEFVTFTYPLEQINEAFHVMHDGKRLETHLQMTLVPCLLIPGFSPAFARSSCCKALKIHSFALALLPQRSHTIFLQQRRRKTATIKEVSNDWMDEIAFNNRERESLWTIVAPKSGSREEVG